MPAFEMEKDELDHLVAVRAVRSPAASAKQPPVAGDAAKGREVYERSGCAGCHRIGEDGSVYRARI